MVGETSAMVYKILTMHRMKTTVLPVGAPGVIVTCHITIQPTKLMEDVLCI